MLKIKAAIYRYFGIYLANNEEALYLKSHEVQKLIAEFLKENLDSKDAIDLAVGLWQANNGFHRPWSSLPSGYPKFIRYLHECYLACKHDFFR